MSLAKRFAVLLILSAAAITFAEDFGPVSIEVVPPMRHGFIDNGYLLNDFRIHNKSTRPVEVHFELDIETRGSIRVARTVLMPPDSVANTSLFTPGADNNYYFRVRDLQIYIDRKQIRHELTNKLGTTYRHNYPVLISPALPLTEYRQLQFIQQNAAATSITVAQWGRHLRDYIGLGNIYLSSDDKLPAEVENAIRQWVRLGGRLVVCVAPDAPWPEGVPAPENDIREIPLGWGNIVYCRPVPPSAKAEVEKYLKDPESTGTQAVNPDDPWSAVNPRDNNSRKDPPPKLGQAAEYLRAKVTGTSSPYLDPHKLLPDLSGIPLRLLFCVMLVFTVLIGPVNFWILKRKKKEPWILVTTPAISFLFCVLVILFITFSEGWYSRGRAVAVTLLDQETRQAVTKAWCGIYAPIAPRGGFDFPMEDCLNFQGNGNIRLNLNTSQHFSSQLIRARIPLFYGINKAEIRRERIQVQGTEDGLMRLVNGLGGALSNLAVVASDGRIYAAGEPVEAGASVLLPINRRTSKAGAFPGGGLANQLKLLPDTVGVLALAEQLPPGYYAAAAETPLFFTPGVTPDKFEVTQYIIGKYDISGEEKNAD